MIETILMPTDGSSTAAAAAELTLELARATGARVVVLGVVHPIVNPDTATVAIDSATAPGLERTVDDQVAKLSTAGVAATGRMVVGNQVHETIAETAAEIGAGLIVMGTHGRSGLSRTVIGSVADRVVRHTSVPVLLVPKR